MYKVVISTRINLERGEKKLHLLQAAFPDHPDSCLCDAQAPGFNHLVVIR